MCPLNLPQAVLWRRLLRSLVELFACDRTRVLALCRHVTVDEFDDRHIRGVGGPDARLEHAYIATGAIGITRRQNVEQLNQLRLVEQPRMGETTVRQTALSV
jgi:hypothetical protein